MAIELRQQLRLTQQLIMTPQLQQAIKLLQLSRLELVDMIQQELEKNPALEETPEESAHENMSEEQAESAQTETYSVKEVKIEEKVSNDIDWENYMDEYNSTGKVHFEFENKDAPQFEAFISGKKSLYDHLLWQFLMTLPIQEDEKIGSIIIGNIDRDGYLDVSIEDLANMVQVSVEKVEEVLCVIQSFDPPGVGARDLKESLLIQAEQLNLNDSVVIEIIKNHIKHLENKNYKAIAKSLKISFKAVISAVSIIKNLEPKPGRQFNVDEPFYIIPDIYVYKTEDDFLILLNDDGMPKLHINPYYKKAMNQNGKITNNEKEYLNDKIRSATWLIKSIQQRQKTIYNVMQSIVKFQRDFFEKGIAYLKPMVLKDVAEDIGMHESTVSRVTTNKYAYTPQGIFELKYFFNSSINRIHGNAIASASVQDKIKQLIDNENPIKPYSDKKIVELLEQANVNIARRTVAKYREILKILPSNKRKQY